MLKQNKKSFLSLFLLLFFMANFFAVNAKPAKADESSILPTSSLLTLGSKLGSVGTGVSLGTELVTSIAGGKVGEAVASGANDYVAKPLLITLLYFVKVLPIAGLSALTWVLEPSITIKVLENSNIYIFWAFVRDILNMFFVIILLFSAFATIFQIEKYNYKKIMVKLIFAAFLVNFSFPITRIFIDISNVLLYSLVNIMSVSFYDPQQGAMAILNFSGYAGLIAPAMESSSTSLIISIIAIFLIGITFIAMSFLFIIRLFAFVLLIIFSPVAFVAPAIPGAEKFGSMWWSNLLKYAFFAPIMMLFFYIAIAFMHALNTSGLELQKISGENVSATSQSVVSNLILCLVPVVIIWIGMGIANKFGIAGAKATMGRAKKFAKWVPNATWKTTGIPGGVKKKYESVMGGFEAGRKGREAKIASFLGVKGAKVKDMMDKVEDYKKKFSDNELIAMTKKGDAAAAYVLAEKDKLDEATYNSCANNNKDTELMGALNTKVSKRRADLVANYKANNDKKEYEKVKTANPGWSDAQIKQDIVNKEIGKMTAEKWAEQDWVSIESAPASPERTRAINAATSAFGNLKNEALVELRKRINPNNVAALTTLGIPI